jgi:hypothetical protein
MAYAKIKVVYPKYTRDAITLLDNVLPTPWSNTKSHRLAF